MNAMKTVRRTVLAVVVLSAGFASAAKQATPGEIIRKQIKDEKQQREALAALDVVNGFTVARSQWSQYYLWRFGVDGRESPSDEELAKKTEANLAARKKLVELLPANVGFRMDYGKALMMFDRFAEAQTQFEEAAKLARDGQNGAAALD